jgi:hypothetical protein
MPSQHLLFAGMAPLSTVPDPLNQQTFRFHDTKSGDGGQWFYGKQSKLGGERSARGVERAWEEMAHQPRIVPPQNGRKPSPSSAACLG